MWKKEFWLRQYNDIKGNAKWALVVALWWLVTSLVKMLAQQIPHIQPWMVWTILLCISLGMFIWLAKSLSARHQAQETALQPSQHGSNLIPTLSALNAQTPNVTFNAQEWFKMQYYSPITAEFENNIKIAAAQNQPNNRESFYARFIGVGLLAYLHDMTWAYIFKSQLLMLAELNRRLTMPVSDAEKYYAKAKVDYPRIYANYSFKQWLKYMSDEQLIILHPTNMLEITHRGRDLLKYLAHWGRDASLKAG